MFINLFNKVVTAFIITDIILNSILYNRFSLSENKPFRSASSGFFNRVPTCSLKQGSQNNNNEEAEEEKVCSCECSSFKNDDPNTCKT